MMSNLGARPNNNGKEPPANPSPTDVEDLARRWLLNQRARRWDQSRWLDLDAHDEVTALMVLSDDPQPGWDLVRALVRQSENPQDIADIGIGPLEDLLRNHGPALLERTEQLARADPQFRRALHGINTREPITSMLRRLKI